MLGRLGPTGEFLKAILENNVDEGPRVISTFVSGTGSLNHIGQFFFDETWNDRVFASYPYNTNTVPRTLNSRDWIMQQAGAGAIVKLQYLQSSLDQGLLGYISKRGFLLFLLNDADEDDSGGREPRQDVYNPEQERIAIRGLIEGLI